MGNNCQKFYENKWVTQVRNDFRRSISALYHKKTALEEYLIQLDDSKKVICDNSRNRNLADQAEQYIRDILCKVEQLDPRFKSTLLQSGSFYDEVKVGQPDEYDYMARLELLSKPGVAKTVPTKLGFARFILKDEEMIEVWRKFLCNDVDRDSKQIFENVLTISDLRDEFSHLVKVAMKSVKMPASWQRDPFPKRHGPCAQLDFLVDGFLPEGQLYISIDLAPCITYPNYKEVEFPFYKNLKRQSSFAKLISELVTREGQVLLVPFTYDGIKKRRRGGWKWLYREQLRVSFSLVEKDIFRHFACNSVEKRALRPLKILRDIHLKDVGGRQEWESEDKILNYPPSTILKVK